MKKTNIAGRTPSKTPSRLAAPSPSTKSGHRKIKTLQTICLDQLAHVEPEAIGNALHKLEPLPHLQHRLLSKVLAKPQRTSNPDSRQLWQWVDAKQQVLSTLETLQSSACPSVSMDEGDAEDEASTSPSQELATAIEEVTIWADETEEAEAKEADRIADSWHGRMDARHGRRMLERFGW